MMEPVYEVRCDDCGTVLRTTTSLPRSAQGGRCRACREEAEAFAAEMRADSDRDLRAMKD